MSSAPEIVFYHSPRSRADVVHWLLEELGQPYRLELIDLHSGQQKQPAYLAINPMGKVPAVVHRGVAVTETAAICTHLADAYPGAGLAPPLGDPQRGPYLKWMFFSPGSIEPAVLDRMLKREGGPAMALGYGDMDGLVDVLCKALGSAPYLLGPRFSAADVLIGSALRWGTAVKALPERAEIRDYLRRLDSRPALQRALARDQELLASLGR